MAMVLEGYELIKGCFEVAQIIYDLTQDTSFLKEKCEELSEQIEFTMEPMQKLEDMEGMEARPPEEINFLKRLSRILGMLH